MSDKKPPLQLHPNALAKANKFKNLSIFVSRTAYDKEDFFIGKTHPDYIAAEKTPEPCAICASHHTKLVYAGAMGCVAGGDRWFDYYCNDCGNYYEHNWEWG